MEWKPQKEDILNWFGERGVSVPSRCLKHWYWSDGTLWFVISGMQPWEGMNTGPGEVDMTYTHRDDGSAVDCFELYDTVPFSGSPFCSEATKKVVSNQQIFG